MQVIPSSDADGRDLDPRLHGPRAAVAEVLHKIRLFDTVSAGVDNRLVIFNYHRIRRDGGPPSPFNNNLFGPTATVFEHQVTWLAEHTRILSQDELEVAVRTGRLPARRCSMITFDDGYRDNYDVAYPILKRCGVPAVFFVSSGLTEKGTVGWWDLIAYVIKRSEKPAVVYGSERYELGENRQGVIGAFIGKITSAPWQEADGIVRKLAEACGVELPPREAQALELMTWEQIREAANNGIAIGSHTHNHPVLSRLDSAGQRGELQQSREVLEFKLGMSIRSLAYPVGSYRDFTRETKSIAARCGYELAYSFATGVNDWPCDPFDVKRISAPRQMAFFAAKSSLPPLFGRQ